MAEHGGVIEKPLWNMFHIIHYIGKYILCTITFTIEAVTSKYFPVDLESSLTDHHPQSRGRLFKDIADV